MRGVLNWGLGAGNSFLGGLAAGLTYTEGDVYEGESVMSSQGVCADHVWQQPSLAQFLLLSQSSNKVCQL